MVSGGMSSNDWQAATGQGVSLGPFGLLCSLQLRGSASEQHCLHGGQESHGLSKTVLNCSWGSGSVKLFQGKAGR